MPQIEKSLDLAMNFTLDLQEGQSIDVTLEKYNPKRLDLSPLRTFAFYFNDDSWVLHLPTEESFQVGKTVDALQKAVDNLAANCHSG